MARYRSLTPLPPAQLTDYATARAHLQSARDLMRHAHSSNAADAIARALKSIEGAERHARRRVESTTHCENCGKILHVAEANPPEPDDPPGDLCKKCAKELIVITDDDEDAAPAGE